MVGWGACSFYQSESEKMRFAAFTVLVAICAAVPMRKRIDDDDSISAIAPLKASSIPGPSCTLYNTSGGCNDDPCCTW